MKKFSVGILLILIATKALSTYLPIERFSQIAVHPGAADFSSAYGTYYSDIYFNEDPGTLIFSLNTLAAATHVQFFGYGGTTVSQDSAADGAHTTSLAVTSPGGPDQGFGLSYNFLPSTTFASSYLTRSSKAGVPLLNFFFNPSGLLATGGLADASVYMYGNWTNPGLHTVATYNTGLYALGANFSLTRKGNTYFDVYSDFYSGVGPSIRFSLIGSPVPEPNSSILLLTGLAILTGLGKKNRRMLKGRSCQV